METLALYIRCNNCGGVIAVCPFNISNKENVESSSNAVKQAKRVCPKCGNTSYGRGFQVKILMNPEGSIELIEAAKKEGIYVGKVDDPLDFYKRRESIYRDLEDKNGLQRTFGKRARYFSERGNFDEAIILYKKQEDICRELNNMEDLQESPKH